MDEINDELDLGLDDEVDPLAEEDEDEEKIPGVDDDLEVEEEV